MRIVIGSLLLLISFSALSQVPNADFENWISVGSYEDPVSWQTNNGVTTTVTKTLDSYSGLFALSVSSNYPSIEGKGPGVAYCFIQNNGADTLIAWIKCDSIVGPAKGVVEVVAYNQGQNPLVITRKEITQQSATYQQVELSIPFVSADSLAIVLKAESFLSSTGYEGFVRIKADQLRLQSTIGLTEENLDYNVYPVPTKNVMHIDIQKINLKIELISAEGLLIREFPTDATQVDLSFLPNGIYFLKFTSRGLSTYQKIIKRD
jgi:hypothetical protein